jgi:HD-GYP domain-containing protein (c-di-GMP phosphodiesterase class II)
MTSDPVLTDGPAEPRAPRSRPGVFDSVSERLRSIHARLREDLPGIDRIAVALYDPRTNALATFAHSTVGDVPFSHYEAGLSDLPSLSDLAKRRSVRVIPDLEVLRSSPREHSRRLAEVGYRSSFTAPFFERGELFGFLFFDSRVPDYYSDDVVRSLGPAVELVATSVLLGLSSVQMLRSALKIASLLTGFRDEETGEHLQRVSRYARFTARRMPASAGLTDEFVELLFLFTPAHDVGKLAVPERILLKEGPLTDVETALARSHVVRGSEVVDDVVRELGLGLFPYVGVLRNIVRHHHEAFDGSGYPDGLRGSRIPIEARIVAVADVFDALTSPRPYKRPWQMQAARCYLESNAGVLFDPECVEALFADPDALEEIRARFWDEGAPAPRTRAVSGAWRWKVEAALEEWAHSGIPWTPPTAPSLDATRDRPREPNEKGGDDVED